MFEEIVGDLLEKVLADNPERINVKVLSQFPELPTLCPQSDDHRALTVRFDDLQALTEPF
jgi:hypothetical protein